MTTMAIKGAESTQANGTATWPPAPIPCAVGDYVFIAIVGTTTSGAGSADIFTDSGHTISAGYTQIGSTAQDGGSSGFRLKMMRKKLTSSDITGGNLNTLYVSLGASGLGRILGLVVGHAYGFDDDPVIEMFVQNTTMTNGTSIITNAIGSPPGLTNVARPQLVWTILELGAANSGVTYSWDLPRTDTNGVAGATVTASSGTSTVNDNHCLAADAGKPVSNSSGYIPAKTLVGTVNPGVSFTLVDKDGNLVNTTGLVLNVTINGGPKVNHVPYFDEGTGTDTDGGGTWEANQPGTDGHHYGTGTGQIHSDFWLYDVNDTPLDITEAVGLGNNGHILLTLNVQTKDVPTGDLTGKGTAVGDAKGDFVPLGTMTAKSSAISVVGAPDGMGDVSTPTLYLTGIARAVAGAKGNLETASAPIYFSGKINIIANAKGSLQAGPEAYLIGTSNLISNMKGDLGSVPVEAPPPPLNWDKTGERVYEIGIDRAVIALEGGAPVPWNGLISVVEKTKQETVPVYYDGRLINDLVSSGEFEATVKAITYPDEITIAEGMTKMRHGVYIGEQRPQPFRMCYRTLIGNDIAGTVGYKLHILYNVFATPADKSYETLSQDQNVTDFEWNIVAIPEEIPGFAPTAHFVVDSREIDSWLLEELESLIYGNFALISIVDLLAWMEMWQRLMIIDNGDGTWTAIEKRPGAIIFPLPEEPDLFQIHVADSNVIWQTNQEYTVNDYEI